METEQKVSIDGVEYDPSKLSTAAREILGSIRFVDLQIQQKQNEWAIADTARIAYTQALKTQPRK